MSLKKRGADPSYVEFVVLVSMMMALVALSIDAMLPALPHIGSDLGVQNTNDSQLVISAIFLGLAIGQLFFGPLSDKTGRKSAVYAGYSVFIVGSVLAIFAGSFPLLLVGRLLQGIGMSAPRGVSLALVRDQYVGRDMARVMSFVMTVFILVPMVAPMMGQAILLVAGWRSIFGSLVVFALVTLLWFALRMPETLAPENRVPFSLHQMISATREILGIRAAVGYTVTAGLVSGLFLGYLNSAQQVFQEQYALGERFPLYFALVSLALGIASFLNARLVMRFGMRFLAKWSQWIVFGLSSVVFGIAWLTTGQVPLWGFVSYLVVAFFFVGILFGNLNSLAMEPLGHLAGIGAAVVGSFSTFISMPLGALIGRSYNGTILPLVAGIAILAGLSIPVMRWAEAGNRFH
jgi:DHA1 family bicyclomycin/chloramphenicol resistance-like MFS transporter